MAKFKLFTKIPYDIRGLTDIRTEGVELMEKVIESNLQINKMISSLGELPASPKIVSTVMRLTSDPDTDLNSLERLLSADQSMAAKLLKLSNSSFYGQRKSVSTLKQAILIIGFYTLRSLVVATSIHSMYSGKNQDSLENKLWEHSLATATVSRLLAQKLGHIHVEEIFMAGLLHDIGKLVMAQKLRSKYEEVCRIVESKHLRFIDVEEDQLGFSHADVGMVLLNKWNLPRELVNAVYLHHEPALKEGQTFDDIEPREIPIEFILELGDQLAKRSKWGFDDYRKEDLEILPLCEALEFKNPDFEEIIERLEADFEEELSLFEA